MPRRPLLPLVLLLLNLPACPWAFAFQTSVLQPRKSAPILFSTVPISSTTSIIDRSTLTLLEHINLDIPNHEHALPFYYQILGCGVDPRMAGNFTSSPELDSTVWANCGASQFHLCYSPQTPPQSPGVVGMRYNDLDALKERIQQHCQQVQDESKRSFSTVQYGQDTQGKPQITITDRYNNVFVCRTNPVAEPQMKQPLLSNTSPEWPSSLPTSLPNDCQGMDYLEIPCPPRTAEKIATFYQSVFDATTQVVAISETTRIAMVAFGNIQSTGRADQYLLFKEQSDYTPPSTPNHSQYHIALYVGETLADFEQAYKNAELAGLVWINPRFVDRVGTLPAAMQWNQFRFKDVLDLETGMGILELEHEVRSINHGSWPGREQKKKQEEEEGTGK